jgi:hypothetical protein
MLRLPHYLDKRLINGGKVVSPTRRPHFTPRFIFLKIPDEVDFFKLTNPSGRTGPGVDSASNGNEYQESVVVVVVDDSLITDWTDCIVTNMSTCTEIQYQN